MAKIVKIGQQKRKMSQK